MDSLIQWIHSDQIESLGLVSSWKNFLSKNKFQQNTISKIDFTKGLPILTDQDGRKLQIDFLNDKQSYHKTKGSIKTELIAKALGSGRYGLSVLDLSAGLGIDSVFISQLGFQVHAIERNPILFLALETAWNQMSEEFKQKVKFHFASAESFLEKTDLQFDVIYFDPMFPEKKKSALPKQEMIIFRQLVGADEDATDVVQKVLKLKKAKRLVVKRPIKAPLLLEKPQNQVEGKLIRFDIYGV